MNLPVGNDVCVFTASRTVTTRGREVMATSCEIISPYFDTFVSGCAPGGDTVLALQMYARNPEGFHHICPPDYRHNEDLEQYFRLRQALHQDHVFVHPAELDPLMRNSYMLDFIRRHGGVLHGFPSSKAEQMRGSGTWACIREARRRRYRIVIAPLDGSDKWTENF